MPLKAHRQRTAAFDELIWKTWEQRRRGVQILALILQDYLMTLTRSLNDAGLLLPVSDEKQLSRIAYVTYYQTGSTKK